MLVMFVMNKGVNDNLFVLLADRGVQVFIGSLRPSAACYSKVI
jgi:hypothetical protein